MPFPWKKVKSTRISQLVNDHLHISQKRRDGSSLVVETGFPTSLIDLFIKNREKLKKPSKKRRQAPQITLPDDDPAIEGSLPPPPPPPPSLAGSPSPQRLLPPPPSCQNEIGSAQGLSGVGAFESMEFEGEIGRDRDANGVLKGVIKIFTVAVLALATKRLTVGITVSAVLLLFLEYVGKHCPPLVRIGARLLSYEKSQEPSTRKPASLPCASVQEIQVLESKGIQPGYEEIELVEMAMKREESISKKKSRKAKIRSKMNKIVPKKFRGAKKVEDGAIAKDEGVCEIVEESDNGSVSPSVSDCREEDGNSSICSDRSVIEEADAKMDSAAVRRYMLLCLIVLAGLIGGRPFALLLTLTCLLLFKLGQALPLSLSLSFNVKSLC